MLPVKLSTDSSNLRPTDRPFVFLLVPARVAVLDSNASFALPPITQIRYCLRLELNLDFVLLGH